MSIRRGTARPGLSALVAVGAIVLGACGGPTTPRDGHPSTTVHEAARPASSTTAAPRSTGTTTDVTTTTLAAGLVNGKVTAIGDSLMLDYAPDLRADLHGVTVDAQVGRQWMTGVAAVRALRRRDELGATVIVDLGTNGTVTPAGFAQMVSALAGVRRMVFVTVHVDQPWQSEVNALLRTEVPRTARATLADWQRLAASHPDWFYSDGTHLPIGGAGAQALAHLVATAATSRRGATDVIYGPST